MTDSQPARGCDALKVCDLCHEIIRACSLTGGGPYMEIAKEGANRILAELRRAATEGNEAVSVEMDRLVREHWAGKPSRIVEPVAGGGGEVTDRQVDAALTAFIQPLSNHIAGGLAYRGGTWTKGAFDGMRAALVAALRVKP